MGKGAKKKNVCIAMTDFWKMLKTAYLEQQNKENTEYVDLHKVADIFCASNKWDITEFNAVLQAFYPHLLKRGYGIALEVDATPTRLAQVMRRKHKIVVDGAVRCVIALSPRKRRED